MKNSFLRRMLSFAMSVVLTISCFCVASLAADATVVNAPKKTVFYQGVDWNYVDGKIAVIGGLDLSGTKLSYNSRTYSYYVDDIFGANMYAKSSTGAWAEGENTAKIYCDDFNSSVYATCTLKFIGISKIEVARTPINTDLIMGTHWKKGLKNDVEMTSYDMTGLILSVTYNDSTVKNISAPNLSLNWSVNESEDYIYSGAGTLYIVYAGLKAPFDVNFLESEPAFSLGDVSRDNKISSYDALQILEYTVGMAWFNNTQLKLADVSKDKNINSTDALYILQYVVGLKKSF